MWSFDAATGTKRFRTPFNSQWDAYYAPTVRAGKVYNDGGSYGGMVKVDAATGTLDWFGGLTQVDMWTPAVDDNFAYANLNGSLMALNLADGTSAFSVSVDPGYFSMYQSNTMPVVAGPGKIALRSRSNGANTLAMIDTVTRSIVWSASGQFVNDPVVANNVLYVANGLAIEARSVATGAVLWTWRVDTIGAIANLKYNLVVTNNLLFASTPDRTYAVDLSTHRAVWSYAKTGSKAISANGVLYIQTVNMYGDSDEALSAINLR
jgi:hypothetical protein